MAAEIVLQCNNLTKSFSGFVAVKNVSLSVRRGSIHALIGPNGAGKTTLFNLLTRFVDATSGEIQLDGRDITNYSAAQVALSGVVRSFQISAIFPHFTVRENIIVALQQEMKNSYQFWRNRSVLRRLHERADSLLDSVGLLSLADVPAVDLSYGRKRVVELATTLAADPKVMLLDEPMAGLGREDILNVSKLIRSLAGERTILMVEHNLSVVSDLSDRITVLTRGEVLAEGTYAEVSKDPRVIEAYMGGRSNV